MVAVPMSQGICVDVRGPFMTRGYLKGILILSGLSEYVFAAVTISRPIHNPLGYRFFVTIASKLGYHWEVGRIWF